MANTFRYLRGEDDPVTIAVASATVIEVGDFILYHASSACAINAAAMSDAGSAPANREAAADLFVGIAKDASPSGSTKKIAISTRGVFRLTQASAAAVAFGAGIEIYATTAGATDQTVVAGSTSPIGFCVLAKATAGTDVEVSIQPTYTMPSVNS